MIKRILQQPIVQKLDKGKAILLIGPRQVGKTTLIKSILGNREYLFMDGDDPTVRSLLTNPNTEQLKSIIGNYTTIFIDEAQRIENIGLTLKIITDQFQQVQLLISGSSAFELNSQTSEPLTGRKWEYNLFPISWQEFEGTMGFLKAEQRLELRVLYGMYPGVLNHIGNEVEILKELTISLIERLTISYSRHLLINLLMGFISPYTHFV